MIKLVRIAVVLLGVPIAFVGLVGVGCRAVLLEARVVFRRRWARGCRWCRAAVSALHRGGHGGIHRRALDRWRHHGVTGSPLWIQGRHVSHWRADFRVRCDAMYRWRNWRIFRRKARSVERLLLNHWRVRSGRYSWWNHSDRSVFCRIRRNVFINKCYTTCVFCVRMSVLQSDLDGRMSKISYYFQLKSKMLNVYL